MQTLSFSGDAGGSIEIRINGYERAVTGEYFDDNWLSAQVVIRAGGFNGKFSAAFITSELVAFYEQMLALHTSLKGNAVFQTLEQQLSLTLVGDGLGRIRLAGLAEDQPGIGNRLSFGFEFDQTQLQVSVRALEQVLSKFPVRA